jgi:CheY-like chemotaxis protein
MTMPRLTGSVFAVDDNPVNLRRLVDLLKSVGLGVRAATSGARALEAMRLAPPDVVLLDVEMPGQDGFQVAAELRADPAMAAVRIVFVSANDGALERMRAFHASAADYLTKPFSDEEALARIGTQVEIARLARENEALRAELAGSRSAAPVVAP